jgi:hypothetical protein
MAIIRRVWGPYSRSIIMAKYRPLFKVVVRAVWGHFSRSFIMAK